MLTLYNVCSVPWGGGGGGEWGGGSVLLGDIMSTVGDILNTVTDVQYREGYHDTCGG